MGANLELGGADPNALVGLVRRHRIDVLSLEEYTPQAARRLKVAGLAQLLPYQQEHPVDGPRGAALYSRFPLVAGGDPMLPGEFGQAYATLLVPGAQPVMVEAVHPCAPADSTRIACWKAGLAAEPRATPHGPVRLLLGDFNATVDHSALRALLASGYRDAAEQVGAGLTMTWPYDKPLPKVALDHVLADPRIGVRTVAAYPIRDSDHRAIYAELILPATG
jgi:endonuclease/exonuclease/phosphatase (EEP) superfamily protein YafD